MIARVDNTAKCREADLAEYTLFPEFGVNAKLCWSTNVLNECDAPAEVLFGACTLVILGCKSFHVNPRRE
jgi:hypothetical protein